jgi:hypothetical protein
MVGQALHWFDKYLPRNCRVCKPNAILAVCAQPINNQEINIQFSIFTKNKWEKYWDAERRYIDEEEYRLIPLSFQR